MLSPTIFIIDSGMFCDYTPLSICSKHTYDNHKKKCSIQINVSVHFDWNFQLSYFQVFLAVFVATQYSSKKAKNIVNENFFFVSGGSATALCNKATISYILYTSKIIAAAEHTNWQFGIFLRAWRFVEYEHCLYVREPGWEREGEGRQRVWTWRVTISNRDVQSIRVYFDADNGAVHFQYFKFFHSWNVAFLYLGNFPKYDKISSFLVVLIEYNYTDNNGSNNSAAWDMCYVFEDDTLFPTSRVAHIYSSFFLWY